MKRKDGDIIKRNKKRKEIFTCDECEGPRKNINGTITCLKCGLQSPYVYFVAELDLNSWKKKKSVHKRNKWFEKRIRGIVPSLMIDVLTNDFIKVVKILVGKKLVKKNVSRYSYYIIRLCSRRNVPFITANKNDIKKLQHIKITDIKKGKTKDKFDDNLFGIVYKKLGWSKSAEKNCKYYKKWLKLSFKQK